MKTDLYTKAVLTIIAFALSAIALQMSLPSAYAQSGLPLRVVICDPTRPTWCADVGPKGGLMIETR